MTGRPQNRPIRVSFDEPKLFIRSISTLRAIVHMASEDFRIAEDRESLGEIDAALADLAWLRDELLRERAPP